MPAAIVWGIHNTVLTGYRPHHPTGVTSALERLSRRFIRFSRTIGPAQRQRRAGTYSCALRRVSILSNLLYTCIHDTTRRWRLCADLAPGLHRRSSAPLEVPAMHPGRFATLA